MTEWTTRSKVAATAAIALALVVMLLTVNWESGLLVATGILTMALVGVAHSAALPPGSCPSCKARPRNQQRTVLSFSVDKAEEGESTNWLVSASVERFCTHCRESRRLVEECLVPMTQATTPAEAVVLVVNGSVEPSRILTNA